MLYRPSFCCHCGEKIDAIDWNIFSSRRFCDVCKQENKGFELLGKLAVAGALLLPLSVAGSFIQSRPVISPETISAARSIKPNVPLEPNRQVRSPRGPETIGNNAIDHALPVPEKVVTKTANEKENPKNRYAGQIFYCGAATKKGTACTRKVKVRGYCWQHTERAGSLQSGKAIAGN